MAHGQPDDGMYGIAETIYRLSDMGELAARLGSISKFDRRGDVILVDDFESGISSWQKSPSGGTGSAVEISAEQALSGFLSLKLTTGSDGNKHAYAFRGLAPQVSTGFGLEFALAISPLFTDGILLADFVEYDGSYCTYYRLKYSMADGKLYYFNSANNYTELPLSSALGQLYYQFHKFKIVGNFETNKYKRIIVDDNIFSLSNINAYHGSVITTPRIIVNITVQTTGTTSRVAYLDDVIITQNEP